MRHLLTSVLALSVMVLPVAAHADTFGGNAAFTDTSTSSNNSFQFAGSFAASPFTFTGGVGATYNDLLTITIGNANCVNHSSCGNSSTDALSVAVNFTNPSAQSSGFAGPGSPNYFFGSIVGGDINWVNNSQTVTFSNGASVRLDLPDITGFFNMNEDGQITDQLKLTVLTIGTSSNPGAVSATPEPSSLMLLGTGVMGLAGLVRRRLAV